MKPTRMQQFNSFLASKADGVFPILVAVAVIIVFMFLIFALGCATSDVAKAKKAALISKETAEAAYVSIYLEYKAGRISDADMQEADALYDQWRMAQLAFVASVQAAEAGSSDDIVPLAAELARLANYLAQLALELGVMNDGN